MELLQVSHSLIWLLAVSHSLSGPMELLEVSLWCLLSPTVSPSAMELLHVSHCLSWLLAVSYSFSGPMELVHVTQCLSFLLAD